MGYFQHEAVVATWFAEKGQPHLLADFQARCETRAETDPDVPRSLILGPGGGGMNSEETWIFCWDGSKEGWSMSERCDALRDEFITLCKAAGWRCAWAHVMFGGDAAMDSGQIIVGGSHQYDDEADQP